MLTNSNKRRQEIKNGKKKKVELGKPKCKGSILLPFRDGQEDCCNGNTRCCH